MTLGGAAAAGVRIIVWCKACQHQIEPDPAELAERYGVGVAVLDWRRSACLLPVWQPGYRHGADGGAPVIGGGLTSPDQQHRQQGPDARRRQQQGSAQVRARRHAGELTGE
jgi:hypothetical protein